MTGILNLSGQKRLDLVRQSETAECGLACLAMVAGFHGYKTTLSALRHRFNVSMKGQTLKTMIDIAAALGLSARPVRCELHELAQLQKPAILHWEGNHFVVLEKVDGRRLTIYDPAAGITRPMWSDVSAKFTGIALELSPAPTFQPQTERSRLTLTSLLRISPDALRGLIQSICLSIVIEFLALATPLYTQLAIDNGVVKADLSLLNMLAVTFTLVLVFRVFTVALRGVTLQFISHSISFEMQARVFHHMVRLPLEWFHKRHVGDIQSRFRAIQPIQAFIANGAIAAVFDGVLASLVLVLMLFYSLPLTGIAVSVVLIYLLIRTASIHLQRRLAGDTIVAQANEQTRFLESVRAIETIKASAAETLREGQQRNAIAASINALIRSGNITIAFNGLAALLDGAADIAIVFFGARSIIAGEMTVGMLGAFLAYKMQFGARMTGLVDQFIAWRMLSVDLDRLSDIALTAPEPRVDGGGHEADLSGSIVCRNLSFTYGFGEPPVLSQANLDVAPGDYVAIVGPSGGGKSTLVKLLIGLYRPSSGQVLIDGRPISTWNVRSLRRQIALVSQDDALLSGSIAENIAMFDEAIDMDRVVACATAAQIHESVVEMPMGYETLVGDMGSSLSGGQKQRVMIARALYRRPRILILDEGTSHLDVANERAVNEALGVLKITRVVVAHRPETIQAANRRLLLQNGRLFELTPADEPASPGAPVEQALS